MEGLINLHNTFHGIDWLNKFFYLITCLGNIGFIWLLVASLLFLFKKTRACSLVIFISLLLGHFFNNVFLKSIFERPRPFYKNEDFKDYILGIGMELPVGTSFPSGHAFSSFLCATILALFNKKSALIFFPLAFLIAISRAYLCVHYPSDILVGSILGVLFGLVCYYFYKVIVNKIERNKRLKVHNEKL